MRWFLIFWFATILFGVISSILIITDWFQQWMKRPYEAHESRVMKQSIPFPSVTICTEGTTLWPSVQAFHEQFQVSSQEIPLVSAAYVRLNMHDKDWEVRGDFAEKGVIKYYEFLRVWVTFH